MTPEEVWRRYDADELRLSAPLSERMLDLAGLQPGMRVLDLATGRGEPAIRAAHRVGVGGRVVGVDLSPQMLQMARERAEREGLTNLELHARSAESLQGLDDAPFQVALARWGLMYLDAPVAALSAARAALAPHGVLVAAVWAEPEQVSYFTLPRQVLSKYRPVPTNDLQAPGPFHYADPARLQRDFSAAGLTIEHLEDFPVDVMEAATGEALIAWCRAFGLNRLLEGLPEETQRAWERDLIAAAEPLRREGFVRLGGVSHLVVARPAGQPIR